MATGKSKARKGTVKWDSLVKEAQKDAFQIEVSDTETIDVAPPTGAQSFRLAEAQRAGDLEAAMKAMTGDAWPRVRELILVAPGGVMEELVIAMMVHFGEMTEITLVGPGGGEVVEADPRKIQNLIKAGYEATGK